MPRKRPSLAPKHPPEWVTEPYVGRSIEQVKFLFSAIPWLWHALRTALSRARNRMMYE